MRNRITLLALALLLCAALATGAYAQEEPPWPYDVQVMEALTDMWGLEYDIAPGQMFDVYTGPGEKYLRAADGKASVSTNGKVEFCGVDGDWVLVRYDINSKSVRYGYVSQDILPAEARAMLLQLDELEPQSGMIQVDNSVVRDDTRGRQDELRPLERGAKVMVIARLADWLYVDDSPTNPDKPCRGFVWFQDITFAGNE